MRQLHFAILPMQSGYLASAWRASSASPASFTELGYHLEIARLAERGRFDAVFLADLLSITGEGARQRPFLSLEPTVVLAALAAETKFIGLIGTASTTYNEPFNIARRFASLDHISGGRAGWNIVGSADLRSARNFGRDHVEDHPTRYARAAEFVRVAQALWDSWEEDAFIGDKATGRFVDPAKVHPVAHRGTYYSVDGPLNVIRSPQGWPVLAQAGASHEGRDLAAAFGEVLFNVSQTVEEALAYARDVRARAAEFGRDPALIRILPGLGTVIGGTEAEAQRRHRELIELIPIESSLAMMERTLGLTLGAADLDRELPADLPIPPNIPETHFKSTVALARREKLTVRQLIHRLPGSTQRIVVGTPEQIADDLAHWFQAGAADGFTLRPDVLPDGLAAFVDHVVPILQRRGLFRRDYEHSTLRGHLGLPVPRARPAPGVRAAASLVPA
ncbi:MAG TPA: LLM class flavin-dependent oxidoreductase [Bryobacteraceae bacterium]|nr:LLM class flavin-dependent oxidoreductase [Bryobacteraceae bacterium]